jgi:hypothetical protein
MTPAVANWTPEKGYTGPARTCAKEGHVYVVAWVPIAGFDSEPCIKVGHTTKPAQRVGDLRSHPNFHGLTPAWGWFSPPHWDHYQNEQRLLNWCYPNAEAEAWGLCGRGMETFVGLTPHAVIREAKESLYFGRPCCKALDKKLWRARARRLLSA